MKYIFLITLFFSSFGFAQNKSTVFVSAKFASNIGANDTAKTSPALTITVPAGQYCDVVLSMSGSANTAGDMPQMRLLDGATTVFVLSGWQNGTSPYRSIGISPIIRLKAGSYTYNTSGSFAATAGNAYYFGACYYL
jgi:hypothetical protein